MRQKSKVISQVKLYCLLISAFWLLVTAFWLLVTAFWLLVTAWLVKWGIALIPYDLVDMFSKIIPSNPRGSDLFTTRLVG